MTRPFTPSNPISPPSLVPTAFQRIRYHSTWINVIPFPRVRDNLIRYEGRFDPWELMQDLVGDLLSSTPAPRQRDTPVPVTVPETRRSLTVLSASVTDEVTTGARDSSSGASRTRCRVGRLPPVFSRNRHGPWRAAMSWWKSATTGG